MSEVRLMVVVAPHVREMIFTSETWKRLCMLGPTTTLDTPGDPATLRRALPGTHVLVTSWGAAPLDANMLDEAPDLRLVAHSASSVKHLVTNELFSRGVRVTQAGQAMARPVAEVALTFTLAMLHRVHRFDRSLRGGSTWMQAQNAPARREILASRVGVVGASRTGVAYIRMVRALGAEVVVYDPWLDHDTAADLGVSVVGLDELMQVSRVVAVHAPSLPETEKLIGRRELALMPDGAAVVNTARSSVVDEGALLEEVRSGRLDAALDVFDAEPLPPASPWRALPNVLLTPHQAAGTVEGRHRLGDIVVAEIERFNRTGTLEHEVTDEALARMG